MRRLLISIVILLSFGCENSTDSDPVSSLRDIQIFDAWIPHDRYVSLLSNRLSNEKVPVDIFIDGEKYSGTVEPQGAGSRYRVRWSFKLVLREGQTINGLHESNLSAQVYDASRLRTPLATQAFATLGFPTVASRPFFLRINGEPKGLYLQIERLDEDYFLRHSMTVHELIKCGTGARFSYEGGLQLAQYFEKEIPKSVNLNDFGDFIHALDAADPDRMYEQVSPHFNIDQYLRYHALSSVLNHIDGFRNNLYFYRATPQAPYSIIPWDFDEVLHDAADVGLAGDNGIIRKLLQSDSCTAVYKRELWRALDFALADFAVDVLIDSCESRIAAAFQLDPWLGGADISLSDESNRLKTYLRSRKQFFRDSIATITRFPR
ncbi:MAG: CotH kinase family protein [Bacteroidota bacterium]|jgi:spore coat protein H